MACPFNLIATTPAKVVVLSSLISALNATLLKETLSSMKASVTCSVPVELSLNTSNANCVTPSAKPANTQVEARAPVAYLIHLTLT
jgi:hypothetical protein